MKTAIIDSLRCIDTLDKKLSYIELIEQFHNLSEHHDSEIKLYKKEVSDYRMALTWQGINRWKVDCPITLGKFHRQRYATAEECQELIQQMYQNIAVEDTDRFIDVPIRHFNLDEMIAFKKEDEMMLRGEEPIAEDHPPQKAPTPPKPPQKKSKPRSLFSTGETLDTKEKEVPKKEIPVNSATPKITTPVKPKTTADNSLFQI